MNFDLVSMLIGLLLGAFLLGGPLRGLTGSLGIT